MSVRENLEKILESPEFAPNIVVNRLLPAEEGSYVPFPEGLDQRLADALRRRGIDRLYTHQAEVWERAHEGKNVVVVTPTASGKTLCYNLPCLQALLADESARCLYLFPTKALSQDQQSELNELSGGDDGLNIKITTYDGDTPESLRVSARDTGRIIISNPDMLHTGILPNHPKWIKFFSRLKFVVIDEAHAYRGVLGSHVANIIRRLRRVTAFYGAAPQFILCSATIGNPAELAGALIGLPVSLVDKNGAPRGEKRIILYNPPLVDSVQGIRRSAVTESRRWMIALLKAGIKTILFAHSRVKTEVAASYVNEDLANIFTDNSHIRVEPYRGGLLPNERREIERGLREGAIQGVVSTNALELGIDIGGLDASVVAGFPGSFNSFWQQAGRAGRRGGTSVSVFVATASPIDQFIMNDPDWFFRKNAEEGRVDPLNPYILTDHVKCGCFELPYTDEEVNSEQLIVNSEQSEESLGELASDEVIRNDLTVTDENITQEQAYHYLESLAHTDLVNMETGIAAQLNREQRDKLVSDAAAEKSIGNGFTRRQHYAAAAKVDKAWKYAVQIEDRDDYADDTNIRSIKRFVAPLRFSNETAFAKILVKESIEHGHRIYTVELQEINKLRAMVGTLEKDERIRSRSLIYTKIAQLAYKVNPLSEIIFDTPDPQSPILDALEYLEEAGIVRHAADKWHWADRSYPAEGISIRSATAENVVIIDVTAGRNIVIGEMDRPSAKELIFDNAVYIHLGRQYLVEKLDMENHKCLVREAEVNYFTDGLVKTDIKVLTEDENNKIRNEKLGMRNGGHSEEQEYCGEAVLGDVLVRSQVAKFKKIRFHTHENIGYGDIDLPEEEMQTRALALLFGLQSAGGKALAEMDEAEAGAALSGAGTLIRNIAPVYLLCDPRDLGIAERVRDPHFGVPALFVYDKYPGGTGLAEGLVRRIEPLFAAINEAVKRCPCKTGCPSCVGPGGNKAAAQKFIDALCFYR